MTDKMYFDYSHVSEEGNWCFNKHYEYGTTWNTVLTDFLSYLSGIYGYNLHEKVTYKNNPIQYRFEGDDECGSW